MAGARHGPGLAVLCFALPLLQLCTGSDCLSDLRLTYFHSYTYWDSQLLDALWDEVIDCFQRTCTDAHPMLCEGNPECKSELSFESATRLLLGMDGSVGQWEASQMSYVRNFGNILLAHACPRSCQMCGPERSSSVVAPCEPGWSHADGACFKYDYGGRSRQHTKAMSTWFEAEEFCQAEGAHLAKIETVAQEHLVFQLVKQRPPKMRAAGLWAWVGLSSGSAGCSQTSNWTWVGSPDSGVAEHVLKRAVCKCSANSTCGAAALYTNSLAAGETMTLSAELSTKPRRAWICSRPAMLRAVTHGSCQNSGLLPISDHATCEAAAVALLGMRRIARNVTTRVEASGCWQVKDRRFGKLFSTKHVAGQELSTDQEHTLLCLHANATLAKAASPLVAGGADSQGPASSTQAAGTFDDFTVTVVVLFWGLFPVAVLLVASARELLLAVDLPALCAPRPWRARHASAGEKRIALAVRAKLQRWRDAGVKAPALLLACFHLAQLVRASLIEEAVCAGASAQPWLRGMLAAVHLANVWAAAGLFALRRFRFCEGSAVPRLVFLLAVAVLELAETTLLGEQALLVESRIYRQLLWRLVFGACASPALALVGNALFASGMCAIYGAIIPDGMVFTVGSMRSGLLSQQGCNSLWESTAAESFLAALEVLTANFDGWTSGILRSAGELLKEALRKQTSLLDFMLTEIVLLAVVAVCILLLHCLLHRDVSQSLRLQRSDEQLSAISRMLGSLCDATFQLKDYCIAAPAPKLDVLLHLAPTHRAMEGQDFRDMAARPEDRASMQEALRPGAIGGVLEGEAVYLDLRATDNATIRVQLLCAEFADEVGERCLLCGVNELTKDCAQGGDTSGPEEPGPLPRSAAMDTPRHRRSESKGLGTPAKHARSDISNGSESEGEQSGGEGARSPSQRSGSGGEGRRSPSRSGSGGGSRRSPSKDGSSAGRSGRHGGLDFTTDIDGRARNVGGENLVLEVSGDSSAVCSASPPLKGFLGLELKPGRKLTSIAPEPAELLSALQTCLSGAGPEEGGIKRAGELQIVLNTYPTGAGGGRQKHPYELRCKAEVVMPQPASSVSDPTPPKIRLQVLTTRRILLSSKRRTMVSSSRASGAPPAQSRPGPRHQPMQL